MYCIDSSVLAAIALQEDERLEKILKNDVVTLDFAFVETLNVIWKRAYLYDELEDVGAPIRRLELLRDILDIREAWEYRGQALDISRAHRIPVYEALFIACALEENAELVTLDSRQHEVYRRSRKHA